MEATAAAGDWRPGIGSTTREATTAGSSSFSSSTPTRKVRGQPDAGGNPCWRPPRVGFNRNWPRPLAWKREGGEAFPGVGPDVQREKKGWGKRSQRILMTMSPARLPSDELVREATILAAPWSRVRQKGDEDLDRAGWRRCVDRLRLRLVLGVAEVLTGVSRCSRARRRQLGLLALLNSGASPSRCQGQVLGY